MDCPNRGSRRRLNGYSRQDFTVSEESTAAQQVSSRFIDDWEPIFDQLDKSLEQAGYTLCRLRRTEEDRVPAQQTDTSKRQLCSLPICGSAADWFTDFFGGTEYYCDKHKPMIPQSLLKRAGAASKE